MSGGDSILVVSRHFIYPFKDWRRVAAGSLPMVCPSAIGKARGVVDATHALRAARSSSVAGIRRG
jgi:hypothetical protein